MNACVESVCPSPAISEPLEAPSSVPPQGVALLAPSRVSLARLWSSLPVLWETPIPLIVHVHIESFYAAVEQAGNPQLKGQAVLVVGAGGVVASASAEAQRRGALAGMKIREARRHCPAAMIVPGDYGHYAEYAKRVRTILEACASTVEMAACGSFYLDFAGSKLAYSRFETKLRRMQSEILGQTGLNAAVGAGTSRMVAALAAREHRPCGLRIVVSGAECRFLAPFAIEKLRGLRQNDISALKRERITTVGELQRIPKPVLAAAFGSVIGHRMWNLARGRETTQFMGFTPDTNLFGGSGLDRPFVPKPADRVARWAPTIP